jgi:hypothetical protein
MAFIRTLIYIIIIYYVVRIIMRYLIPAMFGSYINKRMNDFANASSGRQNTGKRKREGEVTIEYNNQAEEKKDQDRGEYIDYEEIKD